MGRGSRGQHSLNGAIAMPHAHQAEVTVCKGTVKIWLQFYYVLFILYVFCTFFIMHFRGTVGMYILLYTFGYCILGVTVGFIMQILLCIFYYAYFVNLVP